MSQNVFVCTHLNGFKYNCVTLTIQINTSHLLASSEMVKQFSLTLAATTTLVQRGSSNNVIEGALHIPQNSWVWTVAV